MVGVASSAVFNLSESDAVFKTSGEEAYRAFQQTNIDEPLAPGMAFPFIRRLLSINQLAKNPNEPLVEVILLSRNDPDTDVHVMKTIEYYGLGITRAIFMQGKSPCAYIPALNISLFLFANEEDVHHVIEQGYPAGYVLNSKFTDDEEDEALRIAFDFDGVLASDESESVM